MFMVFFFFLTAGMLKNARLKFQTKKKHYLGQWFFIIIFQTGKNWENFLKKIDIYCKVVSNNNTTNNILYTYRFVLIQKITRLRFIEVFTDCY